jgi:hypothetical protein
MNSGLRPRMAGTVTRAYVIHCPNLDLACPPPASAKIIPCISRDARRCRLPHTYDASFTVTDATTLPFRVPVSRNDGSSGFNTTAAISPSLA